MKRTFIAVILAIFVGLPVGWITSMLLTPVLWRLEPVLHIELAGHYPVWAVVIPALFFLFRLLIVPRRDELQLGPSEKNR